ncbi:MAG TPA: DUF4351 domain-containing protein [Blastocatellia bacterium]|nr:DUF4351 domain-containing protein [Blastocatellia bacterium]
MPRKKATAQDSAWKDLLDAHFEEFIAFFFPDVFAGIDWARGYEFMDKELARLGRGHAMGARLADKLAKCWLLDGNEVALLLHNEVQDKVEDNFNQRMYVYSYRIFDKYGWEVVSLAVVTGQPGRKKLGRYEVKRWGGRLLFEFNVTRITDWRGRETELLASENPFALVVLAQLKILELRRAHKQNDDLSKYAAKRELIRLAYQRGYERKYIESLLRFIDWIMILPDELEQKLDQETEQYKEDKPMPYVTHWERRGEKTGQRKLILSQLAIKFGQLTEEAQTKIETLPTQKLERLGLALLKFASPADLDRWLKRNLKLTPSQS